MDSVSIDAFKKQFREQATRGTCDASTCPRVQFSLYRLRLTKEDDKSKRTILKDLAPTAYEQRTSL